MIWGSVQPKYVIMWKKATIKKHFCMKKLKHMYLGYITAGVGVLILNFAQYTLHINATLCNN